MSKDWIGCAAWAAVGVGSLVAAADLQVMTRFGPGPGLFIRGLAILMLGLAVAQAVGLLLSRRTVVRSRATPDNPAAILNADENDEAMDVTQSGLVRFAALAVTLFAYGLVLERVGFLVSTTLLAFVAMTVLGRSASRSAIEAVMAVVVAWLVFGQLLGVNLPNAAIAPLAAIGL